MYAKRVKKYFHAGKILAARLVIEKNAVCMLCLKENKMSLYCLTPETSPLLQESMACVFM